MTLSWNLASESLPHEGQAIPLTHYEKKFKLSNSNKNKNSTLFLDVCIIIMV